MGLAFALDLGKAFDVNGQVLLPTEGIKIWAMADVGKSYRRGVLLTELKPELRHGTMVSLMSSGPVFDILLDADDMPQNGMGALPEDEWHLTRLAAQMDWTMAAAAAKARRQGWDKVETDLQKLDWVSTAARHAVEARLHPEAWTPLPFVRSSLQARCGTQNFTFFPLPLRTRLLDDLRERTPLRAPANGRVRIRRRYPWVTFSQGDWEGKVYEGPATEFYVQDGEEVRARDALACDWPDFPAAWHLRSIRRRWEELLKGLTRHFARFIEHWWERQRLGEWLPVSLAACESVKSNDLAWDLRPAITPYFDDELEAYIVPPVFPKDLRFHGELAQGVTFDLRCLFI